MPLHNICPVLSFVELYRQNLIGQSVFHVKNIYVMTLFDVDFMAKHIS